MPIKHLVLSGGGPTGFITYGVLKQLHIKKIWDLKNIKSIYGCSIGAMIGVSISLGYEWSWLDDYFTKRPWHKIIDPFSFIDIIQKKGFLGIAFFEKALGPLLTAKDLTVTSTLKDLYDLTKIELHVFSTNINPKIFQKTDISYKTHPNLSIVQAVAMSGAIPIVFQPMCYKDGCYIDGGLLTNFPLKDCIDNQKCNEDEVLALRNMWCRKLYEVNDNTNIFDYILILLKRFQLSMDTENEQPSIKNTVRCLIEDLNTFEDWYKPFTEKDLRDILIKKGINQANLFLSYVNSK